MEGRLSIACPDVLHALQHNMITRSQALTPVPKLQDSSRYDALAPYPGLIEPTCLPVPSFQAFVQSVAPVPQTTGAAALPAPKRSSSIYSARPCDLVCTDDGTPPPVWPQRLDSKLALRGSLRLRPASIAHGTTLALPTLIPPRTTSKRSKGALAPQDIVLDLYKPEDNIGCTFFDDADDSEGEKQPDLFDVIRSWRISSTSSMAGSSCRSSVTESTSPSLLEPRISRRKPVHSSTWDGTPLHSAQPKCTFPPLHEEDHEQHHSIRRQSSAPQLMFAPQTRVLFSPQGNDQLSVSEEESIPSVSISPSDDDHLMFAEKPAEFTPTTRPRAGTGLSDTSSLMAKEAEHGRLSPRRLFFKPRVAQKRQCKAEISGPVEPRSPGGPNKATGLVTVMLGNWSDRTPSSQKADERRAKEQARRERMREELKASIKVVGEVDPSRIMTSDDT